jgi:PmbA protein
MRARGHPAGESGPPGRFRAGELLDRYLELARKRQGHVELRLVESRRAELVARDGYREMLGDAVDSMVTLRFTRAGRVAVLTAPATHDPAAVLDQAGALAAHLPFDGGDPVTSRVPAAALGDDDTRRAATSLAALADEFVAATRAGPGAQVELRCIQAEGRVTFVSEQSRGSYRTSTASVLCRATHRHPDGRSAQCTRADHGPDLVTLHQRLESRLRDPTMRAARLLATAGRAAPPSTVLFEGHVATELLALFARGLSAEAVAEGRSRLAERLGTMVAAGQVTVVDDPRSPDAPMYATFDDEGNPTSARTLVADGRLVGLLGSHDHTHVAGSAPGNAWSGSPGAPARPTPSNLWIVPATTTRPVGPYLRIVHCTGMHMSNEITGEFSMGAEGVVESDSGVETPVTGLTVAGNVYDLFGKVTWIGPNLAWSGGRRSYFGAPDLMVPDLAVGV